MKFFPWDFQNFSLGNGKSKIPFSLGIPMMGIPRAETLGTIFKIGQKLVGNVQTKKLKCDNLGDFQTLSFGLADFPNVDIV